MSNAPEKPLTAPADPEELVPLFEHAFNTRNLDLLEELFEPDALLVLAPGEVLAGDERRARNQEKLPHFLPIKVAIRHQYITGDIALLINDYVHEGTTPDGKHLRIEGTAVDVLRRGADGAWRCLISNPAGIKTAGELPH
ncbi:MULTISPECIES: nuclear transport factor 2 family protein [unclassified Micromonospora]|uniref:YybH family protein n=1 Tax=unclassified Micromonospora TaxID=2617518 RepID=UPI00340F2B68